MILGYHATFSLHAFESCMKLNFDPQISIHIWCDYFMSDSLVYTANHQKLVPLWNDDDIQNIFTEAHVLIYKWP